MIERLDSSLPAACFSPIVSIRIGDSTMYFVSGTTAGQDAPYDIERQTEMVFDKIRHRLAEHGADPSDLVKLTVFLTDIREYSLFSAVRDRLLANLAQPPASSAVEARLGSPAVRIEIEAIAVHKGPALVTP